MPSDVKFSEIRRMLERSGWTLLRVRGTHHSFGGPNRPTIPIPVHKGKVRHEYLRFVEKKIAEFEQRAPGEEEGDG